MDYAQRAATRDQLKALHTMSVIARDAAHDAYSAALDEEGQHDTGLAFDALIQANHVMNALYRAVISSVTNP